MKRYLASGAIAALALSACGSVDPALVTRPDNSSRYQGDRAELVEVGEVLWKDTELGTSGVACESCHIGNAQFKDTFKQPYPHHVAMAKNMSGLESIDAEQMVQFCMIVPMKAEPLPWDSKELAALAAYIEDVAQPRFANQ